MSERVSNERVKASIKEIGLDETIKKILSDPGVHFFTQEIIRKELGLDPVDACFDVLIAAEVLEAHMDRCLYGSPYPKKKGGGE